MVGGGGVDVATVARWNGSNVVSKAVKNQGD